MEILEKGESAMKATVNKSVLDLVQGDITQQDTDAIVNAANQSLLGGGGVDGAIHRAAGPQLLAECRTLGGCATGNAKITKGYQLKARHIIHTVGPVHRRQSQEVRDLLASTYRRSLEVARENGLTSLAFPSISTGAYGYPVEEAAPIALSTVINFVKENPDIQLVRFVLFSNDILEAYEKALRDLTGQGG